MFPHKREKFRLLFAAIAAGLLTVAGGVFLRADSGETRLSRQEKSRLRFKLADREDLLKRLEWKRRAVRGVWAAVRLTREIIVTELEVKELRKRLGLDKTEDSSAVRARKVTEKSSRRKKAGKGRKSSKSRKTSRKRK